MSILAVLLVILPFFIGLYYEWAVSISVICLTGLLAWTIKTKRRINLYLSTGPVCLLVVFLGAIVSLFSGIAAGTGVYGVLRMVGVMELMLLLMQDTVDTRRALITYLPWAGLFYFLVSLLFYFLPGGRGYVYIDGRFAGLMGYANVTAAFFLISLICENEKPMLPGRWAGKFLEVLQPLLMGFGILWTGSRLTAVLLLLFWLYILIQNRSKRLRNFLMGAGSMALVAIYLANIDHYSALGRFRELFLANASSMIRPAYWLDAIRALVKRPLGFGYEGFFISQGAIQSGPYYVRWLHNGFLECAYSFGWIAGIAAVVLAIWSIGKAEGIERLLLLIFAIRFFLDFDMQFLGMVYICLACMDWKEGRKYTIGWDSRFLFGLVYGLGALILVFSFWIGSANLSYYRGDVRMASKIYPYDWEYQLQLMETDEKKEKAAEKVVSLNPYCSAAWLALSDAAGERGDFRKAVSDAVRAARYDSARPA
ncbi:MAG: O-antigen ligase family protein, partial [Lachnospiraceae bacterium]|nr:O-antigen ligase family protein [Lachnospiraceae bacterium]